MIDNYFWLDKCGKTDRTKWIPDNVDGYIKPGGKKQTPPRKILRLIKWWLKKSEFLIRRIK